MTSPLPPKTVTNADVDLSKAIIIDAHLLKTFRACQEKYRLFDVLHIVSKGRKAAPAFGIAMHEGIATFRLAKKDGVKFEDAYETGAKALLTSYKKHMPAESLAEVMQDDRRSPRNALRIFRGYCLHYEPVGIQFHYIESPFALYVGQVQTPTGEKKDVVYVGIIDAVIEQQGVIYVNDLKSTAWWINQAWLDGFKMDQGLLGYMLAARELLGVDTRHALVHAIWVAGEPKTPKGKKLDEYFYTQPLYWDDDQIREWHTNVLNTITDIEMRKADGKWVMDWGQNCGAFGGCEYRPLCSTTPKFRPQMVEMDYDYMVWSPLEEERMQKMES